MRLTVMVISPSTQETSCNCWMRTLGSSLESNQELAGGLLVPLEVADSREVIAAGSSLDFHLRLCDCAKLQPRNPAPNRSQLCHEPQSASVIRFGVFEVDLTAGEVRKAHRQKLAGQPSSPPALRKASGSFIQRAKFSPALWPDNASSTTIGAQKSVNRLRKYWATPGKPHS